MKTINKRHNEAIGSFKVVGGEFDGMRIEFMGFEFPINKPSNLTGLYMCLEYFCTAMPIKYCDMNSIIWYDDWSSKQLEQFDLTEKKN